MIFRRTFVAGVLTALCLGLATGPGAAEVSKAEAEGAKTVKAFLALGATKLTAAEFKAKVVGKQMRGEGWTWIIAKDGTTSSESEDGSWKEVAQPWHMEGDRYCTIIKEKMTCRDVYLLGKYLRMSDPKSAKKLATWTAKLK